MILVVDAMLTVVVEPIVPFATTLLGNHDLTNTNLIIDSTPPNITLNGDSTITVYTNTTGTFLNRDLQVAL